MIMWSYLYGKLSSKILKKISWGINIKVIKYMEPTLLYGRPNFRCLYHIIITCKASHQAWTY